MLGHFLKISQNNAHVAIFFSSSNVDYNSYEESHTSYFNEIVLQANDVKTWPNGYFTYNMSNISASKSQSMSNLIKYGFAYS